MEQLVCCVVWQAERAEMLALMAAAKELRDSPERTIAKPRLLESLSPLKSRVQPLNTRHTGTLGREVTVNAGLNSEGTII